jgi:hypothetical protein
MPLPILLERKIIIFFIEFYMGILYESLTCMYLKFYQDSMKWHGLVKKI